MSLERAAVVAYECCRQKHGGRESEFGHRRPRLGEQFAKPVVERQDGERLLCRRADSHTVKSFLQTNHDVRDRGAIACALEIAAARWHTEESGRFGVRCRQKCGGTSESESQAAGGALQSAAAAGTRKALPPGLDAYSQQSPTADGRATRESTSRLYPAPLSCQLLRTANSRALSIHLP